MESSSSDEVFSIAIINTTVGRFFPGDVITGYVLKMAARVQTKNVNITCRGKAVASLNGQDFDYSSSRLRFKGMQFLLPTTWKEEYFLNSTICLDEHILLYTEDEEENEDDDNRRALPPPLLFKFHLRLPKVLPPTCELRYGYTSYDLKFEWDTWIGERNAWEKKSKLIPINIGPCVNLNEIPFVGEPAVARREEKFSFLCLNFGHAEATLSVDKVGYIPGEELHFKVQAKNQTKFTVDKITVSLKQERTFCVGELKRKFSKVLATCDGPWVDQGESITWEDYLIVPDVQWKFFWPCNLIRVAFYLQVKLITHKNRCNAPETILENSVSIIIGDIPVNPLIYMQNFGVTMGTYELGTSSEYEPERMWLGIDRLEGEVTLPNYTISVSPPTGGSFRYHYHHHPSVLMATDDHIPSYSSVVRGSHHHRVRAESPPPSYNEALKMRKPVTTVVEYEEAGCEQKQTDSNQESA